MTEHSDKYSDADVVNAEIAHRVLARAIELDAEGGGMTVAELKAIAREVGVLPAALDQAIRDVRDHAQSATWLSRLRSRWRAWLGTSNPTDADEVLPPAFWKSVLLNVLAVSMVWIVVGVLIIVLDAAGLAGNWQLRKAADALALALAAAFAVKVRARFATFALAGFGVAVFAELALDAIYGTPVIRGAAPHFALIAAGLLGVAVGALLAMRRKGNGSMSNSSEAVAEVAVADVVRSSNPSATNTAFSPAV